ncbi:sensor histidine kinase [Evtepia gabavorous]|uniref:sensor histidine kinase n=1 Tax=Evtepia gabavorous TaxID=2211183 RepID=UPI003A8E05ED
MGFFSKLLDRHIAAIQQELMETHYREMEHMYREMRGWRHDFRNHIQLLKTYAQKGDLYAVRSYLTELEDDLKRVDPAVKTGNPMADAILNSKISLAKAQAIPVRVDAHIPVKLSISDLDLCVILGNLFDNAMEANLQLPEGQRMIRIYMDTKGNQLYISFTNLAPGGKQEKVNGRFSTTKGKGHGYGLARIDTVVKRLGGYLRRASEEGAFTTEILLPQEGPQFVP